jgi:hypothetical protein
MLELAPAIERRIFAMYGMKRSRHSVARRQAGATTLGFIILAAFAGLFVFAALRLTPVYLNYMKIVGVVEGVRTEFGGQKPTNTVIRRSLSRRFDVESVSVITYRDITITAVDGGLEVAAVYDHTTPFISNISFTVHFDKSVVVRR